MSAVIELEGLEVRFGNRTILDGLRTRLEARSLGLLGPNGAGKTTLLHTLLGFHPATSGTARVLGHDIRSGLREIRAAIGYMPENDAFVAGMSAVRFVRLMAELSGLPSEAALERAHEALRYVGLGEARYRRLETFSTGMKQMAKLAQAIVHSPKILLLDEPTNGLDPPARRRMIRLVREIRDRGDVRLVVSSHILRDVEECCEQVLVLKDGRIAAQVDLEAERRANRKFLEIETRGDDGGFVEAAGGIGCACAVLGGGRVKLVLPDSVEIRDLYRLAAERSIQIRHLDFKRNSLQDIFLRAMEDARGGP